MKTLVRIAERRPLLAFFVLAYAVSWLLWLPAVVAHVDRQADMADGRLCLFLGNFGPLLAALILSAPLTGKQGLQALLQRFFRWRVGAGWYVIALYGFLAVGAPAAVLLGAAAAGELLSWLPLALVNIPVQALTTFLVLGPLGEELGWRGYALPRLQAQYGGLASSVILGALWALWHAPLLLFPEWRNGLPIGVFLLLYPLYIIPLSIIFTWVYNHTGGSVLIAMLLHSAFNYTVFSLDNRFELVRYDSLAVMGVMAGLLWLVAFVLIAVFGSGLGPRRTDG